MSKNHAIAFILAAVFSVGCNRGGAPKPGCVQAEFTWDGATAEMIAEQLPSMAPGMKLAVVGDGRATVYFEGGVEVVETALQGSRDVPDSAMTVTSIRAITTGIPSPPTQAEVQRIRFNADRDRMAALGITTAALAAAIRESVGSASEVENPQAFRSMEVKNVDGTVIPILDLGSIEAVSVQRPLILQR